MYNNDIKSTVVSVNRNTRHAEEAVRFLLEYLGENPNREGLQDTPKRVVKAFIEHFKGYNEDPRTYLSTQFEDVEGYVAPILLKDIPFYSHCEHHMAPIHGVVSIAYIPDKKIVGISKLARVVESFAKRLQIQEKMTAEIGNCIQSCLIPKGVAVYIQATHHCMMGRGVNIQGATLITYHFTGEYGQDIEKQRDFKNWLKA